MQKKVVNITSAMVIICCLIMAYLFLFSEILKETFVPMGRYAIGTTFILYAGLRGYRIFKSIRHED